MRAFPQINGLSFIISLILWLYTGSLNAQQEGPGSWNILNIRYSLNSKWSIFGEAQLRSLLFYRHFHYYEYKGGFNYQLHPQMRVGLGVGDYDTYKEGGNFVTPKNNDELRIWPHISFNHTLGSFRIEQRYRAEFRFTKQGYRNRFRYRLGVAYPFGSGRKGFQPYQISVGNELFFTNREPYFERNRFNITFSYRQSTTLTFQTGFLRQFDYRINDETGRSFLQLGLFFELYPTGNKQRPGQIDLKDN
jgi:hypothetical protein